MNNLKLLLCLLFSSILTGVQSQSIEILSNKGITVHSFQDRNGNIHEINSTFPFFSFRVDGDLFNLGSATSDRTDSSIIFSYKNKISGEIMPDKNADPGSKFIITIQNNSSDTVDIENIVPFGEYPDHIYMTSTGPWALARAKIFRPGLGPIGVILPDNAWEMGYGSINEGDTISICAVARRTGSAYAENRRYRTIIYPGGKVEYSFWVDEYGGPWQNGFRKMFRDNYLYDVETFNDSLYRREDLQWIRHAYLIGLQFAWNREFYDWKKQEYTADQFLEHGKQFFGGYDVIGLWPTWPRLGVDQRNQWDLFNDLPGGLARIKEMSQAWKKQGTRFFICYNPWDESTRSEDPYAGMARLIESTDADGVVLDCHGASSHALQRAADSVKAGVIMYSEGMAVVEDMPGIVAGRVHDAIVMPPPLNLNKLIKPDFAIFRVCQLHDGRIRREASIALFNGYGTEINTFAPGVSEEMEEDLVYLGKTTRILRENSSNFLSFDWTPLLPTLKDSIWVNKWPSGEKTVYTVFSLIPWGFTGPLFEENVPEGFHLVSIWHHQELTGADKEGKTFIPATVEAFNTYDMGTRTEGNVDVIALFPAILNASLREGYITIDAQQGDEIRLWQGQPSYQNNNVKTLSPGKYKFNVLETFGRFEGRIVIQLFDHAELKDERIIMLEPGLPGLMTGSAMTGVPDKKPEGMVLVPSGTFKFRAENTDQFIPYPDVQDPVAKEVQSFYIDKYPVTNSQFQEFISATGYRPSDTLNFLKHWINGRIPSGLEGHPVVYVSLEDAKAYAGWAGKRLPTEVEWQYAAAGNKSYKWPWGNDFDSTRCNNGSGSTTPVNAFPKGKSPFGVMDLNGNVWQLTDDVYDNGTYYFVIMKGGSFYRPTASWWYVKGGPQPNDWHQQLLLVSPGFDRNATVGFRCVMDAAR